MRLARLRLKDFRSCDATVVDFHEDLTLLAGENNAGKTNILDALRLITTPTEPKWSLSFDHDDIRRGGPKCFELEAEYADLSDAQRDLFIVALKSVSENRAIYGSTFEAPQSNERRGRLSRWVGPRKGTDPEPEARALIRHVHLPALRDAARELASSSPGRIEFLLRRTSEKSEHDALVKQALDVLVDLSRHSVISKVEQLIGKNLATLTAGADPHHATLAFAEPKLGALARDLRFRLARAGLPAAELGESGLGYANLLFLASVLVELRAADDAELTLFLVEEPEAHLHPQLQAITLEFLRDQAEQSRTAVRRAGQHAGRIQIIGTTHSPNMTAAVSVKHVVVVRAAVASGVQNEENDVQSGEIWPHTRAVSIPDLGLSERTIRKLDRYLNVTRAALLFARRVLLVEGIAEALLFPVAARQLFKARPDGLARFRGSTIIAIDGLDFIPYLELLLSSSPNDRTCIADRVVVVTDTDTDLAGELRPGSLEAKAAELRAAEKLHVHSTPLTLEAALFVELGASVMRTAFNALRPKSEHQWDKFIKTNADDDTNAASFVHLLKECRLRKGDFAQELAEHIQNLGADALPPCLTQPLELLVAID